LQNSYDEADTYDEGRHAGLPWGGENC